MRLKLYIILLLGAFACQPNEEEQTTENTVKLEVEPVNLDQTVLKPQVVTDTTRFDTDDPAIWINPKDTAQSLIVGTDKNEDGALYVYNLQGEIIQDKVVSGLKRPNNVDIEYGLMLNGTATDIAVVSERLTHKIRIFSLPDMQACG